MSHPEVQFRSRFLRSLSHHSMWRYSFEMALLGMAMRLPAIGLWLLVMVTTSQYSAPTVTQSRSVLGALVVAPLLETLIGQVLPVGVVAMFSKNPAPQIIVSSVLFAGLHFLPNLGGIFGAIAVLGSCIAMNIAYVSWRHKGFWPAYWVTALVHAWTNALALLLGLITR